jgi:ADP-heptose:LPS heptosyltransferase
VSGVAPRLLFVPVSGPRGMGEFGRAVAMAEAAVRRWPDAAVHFALSREAPYAASLRFPATLLPSSATFHSRKIRTLIRDFRPTIVVFDNAGRTAQLRAARASGARIVFVSARARQRRKAFRLRWMRLIDEHWIAYPNLIAGATGWLESAKLRLLGRPRLRYLDPILPEPDKELARVLLDRLRLRPQGYVVVVPGGGTVHRGNEAAMEAVISAARRVAMQGIDTVLVGVDVELAKGSPGLRVVRRSPLPELAELIRHARLAVVNGGYTLLQALALDRPCLAVPLARDQQARIRRCAAAGLAVEGRPDAALLENEVRSLLQADARLKALAHARAAASLDQGARTVVNAFAELGA